MNRYIVIKSSELNGTNLPLNDSTKRIMENEGFKKYVSRNGYHFTEELAAYAAKEMKPVDSSVRPWSIKEVESAMKMNGLHAQPGKNTKGDLAYVANMAKSDFYPEVISNETDCIKYAIAVIDDPDGYDGLPFMRYLADLIGKRTDIDWGLFA